MVQICLCCSPPCKVVVKYCNIVAAIHAASNRRWLGGGRVDEERRGCYKELLQRLMVLESPESQKPCTGQQ